MKSDPTLEDIVRRSWSRAIGGGLSGALAMGVNVTTLMWLRTTVNYQYRYGTSMETAFRNLYRQGGLLRFYRGYFPALVQGPLSRFGDTAANTGVLTFLNSFPDTNKIHPLLKTLVASLVSATWRLVLMPLDTLKTYQQVNGADGISMLRKKMQRDGPKVLFYGATASFGANVVGHYPWFATYNVLDSSLPEYQSCAGKLVRNGLMGFLSSAVSDCCSNSLRVIKVYRQTNTETISYPTTVGRILQEDGIVGLLGRGLSTKILSNGLQGILFSIMWKLLEEEWNKNSRK